MPGTSERRRGIVVVLVALCLTVLLGITAIALDGGLLLDQRRRLQAADDAAALAAAVDLYKNYALNNGLDKGGTAKSSALSIAAINGYNNNGTTNSVTVNIPPGSGNYAGQAGYAEVVVQYNQQRSFSAIFGSSNLPVTARSVARGQWVSVNAGIILLDPGATGALSAVGNASLKVNNGSVIVDSTSASAVTLNGNASVTAPTVDISGTPGYALTGNAKFGAGTTVLSGQPPVPDPLAYLAAPTQPSPPSGNTSTIYNPGYYANGISLAGNSTVTLTPGIYYIHSGFSVKGNASVTGAGVMIYNDGSGGVDIAGNGVVTLSPPTSGPYTGITLFQNRGSSTAISITGNGNFNLSGTFYAAAAVMDVKGNGDNLGTQFVSKDLSNC